MTGGNYGPFGTQGFGGAMLGGYGPLNSRGYYSGIHGYGNQFDMFNTGMGGYKKGGLMGGYKKGGMGGYLKGGKGMMNSGFYPRFGGVNSYASGFGMDFQGLGGYPKFGNGGFGSMGGPYGIKGFGSQSGFKKGNL